MNEKSHHWIQKLVMKVVDAHVGTEELPVSQYTLDES